MLGSLTLGGAADEAVGRPCVAAAPSAVGTADPMVKDVDRLGRRGVAVPDWTEVGWFGCWASFGIASFCTLEPEIELTWETASGGSSLGLESESATKFALP